MIIIKINKDQCDSKSQLVPALDAGSHENQSYEYRIDQACFYASPHRVRGQGLLYIWSKIKY